MLPRRLFLFFLARYSSLLGEERSGADLNSVSNLDTVRVAGIGDFGYAGSGSGRRQVADAILARHSQQAFQLGLTFGDNFYPRGVKSVTDEKWSEWWEPEYGRLKFPFYAALGNHDYAGREQAEIDYSAKTNSWRMPGRYYTFAAGPVRFFCLDTDEGSSAGWIRRRDWSDTQAFWLDGQLKKYKDARWKIVYGHHPIYSDGEHGDTPRLIEKLLPILQAQKVDAYLCGHDHDLQHHVQHGIHFFVSGGGGKDLREIAKRRAVFALASHGFLDLTASHSEMQFRFIATSGQELYSQKLTK